MACLRAVLPVVTLLLAATAARADEPAGKNKPARWFPGALFGIHFFDDDLGLGRDEASARNSDLDNGAPVGLRLLRLFGDSWGGEAEVDLIGTDTRDDRAGVFSVGYRAHAMFFFLPRPERLRPFVLVGGGGRSQSSGNTEVIGSGTIGFLEFGGGAMFRLGERYGVRADLRLLLSPDQEKALAATDVELLFGVWMAWDAPRPKGTARAEPTNPIADDDGDGVDDADDKCPYESEDADGVDDGDGCPDPDEDIDGDKDGIYGSLDRCPKEKENENGYLDDDGCPDQLPAKVAELTGSVEGIVFASGSDRLERSSYAILDKAAAVLVENPSLKVTIVGHTDDQGNRNDNINLSLRRAEAVKAYLVDKGVDPLRLEALGKGPDQPMDDNATPEGRARNRRIEFLVTAGTSK